MMIIAASMLFAFTVFCGLVLALLHTLNIERPWALTILHGVFAVSALVLLGVAVLTGTAPAFKTALILFVVTAFGGTFLFTYRIRGKPPPSLAVILHAVLAAAAVTALVLQFGTIRI